jgi:TonB family protein
MHRALSYASLHLARLVDTRNIRKQHGFARASGSLGAPRRFERSRQVAQEESAEYSDLPHVSARSRCEDTRPPQALTTPDPLLVPSEAGMRVKVSFIIGADGRVHSPLILQSGGFVGDRNVLRTVRSWRYRPATCNGVPTEAEGKIEFSRR